MILWIFRSMTGFVTSMGTIIKLINDVKMPCELLLMTSHKHLLCFKSLIIAKTSNILCIPWSNNCDRACENQPSNYAYSSYITMNISSSK